MKKETLRAACVASRRINELEGQLEGLLLEDHSISITLGNPIFETVKKQLVAQLRKELAEAEKELERL